MGVPARRDRDIQRLAPRGQAEGLGPLLQVELQVGDVLVRVDADELGRVVLESAPPRAGRGNGESAEAIIRDTFASRATVATGVSSFVLASSPSSGLTS